MPGGPHVRRALMMAVKEGRDMDTKLLKELSNTHLKLADLYRNAAIQLCESQDIFQISAFCAESRKNEIAAHRLQQRFERVVL